MKRREHTQYSLSGLQRVSRSRLTRRRLVLAIMTGALVVTMGGLFYWMSRPVEGRPIAASSSQLVKQPVKIALATPPVSATSAYFTLTLPAGYKAQPGSTETPGLLYQQTIIKASAFGSLVIAIGIKSLPEGGLSADSSYTLRLQHPGRYHFVDQQVGDDTVKLATDSQSASTVVFWAHGGYLATIGVTTGISNPGNDNSEQLVALQSVLKAWQWR